MGKGAYVSISNSIDTSVTVSYGNFSCMHQNGKEGSDFNSISGTLEAGESWGKQYIEADGSFPWCAGATSTFDMSISGNFGSFVLKFSESGKAWSVENGEQNNNGVQVTAGIIDTTINVNIQKYVRWQPNSWMSDLSSVIGNRQLNKIALPGTHDSATYDINFASLIAPKQDIPNWLNAVLIMPGLHTTVANMTIAGWSKTQHLNTFEQLMSGIRYLDLRVVRSGGDYYVCHGKYSCRIDSVISEVQKFVSENPKEIIIFDINHLFEIGNDSEHQALITKLYNAFGNKMAPNNLPADATVSKFQGAGYQIIALYDDKKVVTDNNLNPHHRLWSQDQISSPWLEKHNVADLEPAMKKALDNRSNDKLFVLQGIVTPTGGMIALGLFPMRSDPGSIQSLANEVTPAVCGWIAEWKPNCIVIVDWFDCRGRTFVDTVINLNLQV